MIFKVSGKIFVGMLFVFLHAAAHANVKCCSYSDSTTCYTSINSSCPGSSFTGSSFNSDNTTGSAGDCAYAGGAAGSGGGNSC